MPHKNAENCSESNEEVYNTLNISKWSSNRKNEDFSIIEESNNSIVLTYSESPNPCNISQDDLNKILKTIKGVDKKIFSADENLKNNCIKVMLYKKDRSSTILTINIERKVAQLIWDVCTDILNNNGRQ